MPRTTAKQLETRLGLNFQHISRHPRARKPPEISHLLQRVDEIKARYSSHGGIKKIRESEGIRLETLKILKDLGPVLWPDFDENRKRSAPWLLDPSDYSDQNEEHWTAEYPKHLVYSDPIDYITIGVAFREFVDQKVLRYRNNRSGKHPTTQHPPDSDCLTNSEEPEANEDAEEVAEEDGKDTQSDYCPSESSGVQSFDGTPRSGSRSKNMNQYAAPTAPMVPKPSSMGQTRSKLHPDNFAPNQTPETYQKQYRDSMGDRMARGSSRSKPEAASKSPSHNPPEIPAWHQDESIRVGARSASKRVDVSSADSEGEASRKRRKHTEKVPCPRPRLVVKLKVKLTRGKIPRDTHCQHPEADRCGNETIDEPQQEETPDEPRQEETIDEPQQEETIDEPQQEETPTESVEAMEPTREVAMFAVIKREGQPEPKHLHAIDFGKLASRGQFFENLKEDLKDELDPDETIAQAVVKRVSEPEVPGLSRKWTDFTMTEGGKINIGWEMLLKGLERVYRSDGKCAVMELDLCVIVRKASNV